MESGWRALLRSAGRDAHVGRNRYARRGVSVGAARTLFKTNMRGNQYQYDVSRDGQRFLVNTLVSQQSLDSIDLILNWTAALKK